MEKVEMVAPLLKQDTMLNLVVEVGEEARTQLPIMLVRVARLYFPKAVVEEEKRTVLTVGLEVDGVSTQQAVAGQVPHQEMVEMVRPEVMDVVTVVAGEKNQQETLEEMAVRQVEVGAVLGTMVTVAREPEVK